MITLAPNGLRLTRAFPDGRMPGAPLCPLLVRRLARPCTQFLSGSAGARHQPAAHQASEKTGKGPSLDIKLRSKP